MFDPKNYGKKLKQELATLTGMDVGSIYVSVECSWRAYGLDNPVEYYVVYDTGQGNKSFKGDQPSELFIRIIESVKGPLTNARSGYDPIKMGA